MGILDDLKDRLGFGAEEEEFDEELYGEDFDEYSEEFDEYDDGGYDTGYSSFAPVSERPAATSRERSRRGPQLVSIDDVRNSTRIPESLNRDPLPPRRGSASGRSSMGRASDYSYSETDMSAAPADVDATASLRDESAVGAADISREGALSQATSASSYDPYRAFEGTESASHRPTRNISVISPMSYNEVENVARMLRAGDAVVLSLRNTQNQLSKRILDFSFGVASALDATVDCIADKVFAITRVNDLTEDELTRLRNQGVI